jgi:hypothetical protein
MSWNEEYGQFCVTPLTHLHAFIYGTIGLGTQGKWPELVSLNINWESITLIHEDGTHLCNSSHTHGRIPPFSDCTSGSQTCSAASSLGMFLTMRTQWFWTFPQT